MAPGLLSAMTFQDLIDSCRLIQLAFISSWWLWIQWLESSSRVVCIYMVTQCAMYGCHVPCRMYHVSCTIYPYHGTMYLYHGTMYLYHVPCTCTTMYHVPVPWVRGGPWGVLKCWYMGVGTWYRYMVHGTGTWYRYMVYGTGTWYHGTGTWYMIHGTHMWS